MRALRSPARRRGVGRWGRATCSVLLVTAIAACSGGTSDDDTRDDVSTVAPAATTIGDAEFDELMASVADVESVDRRPTLLGDLGGPDAFVITVDEIGGVVSRFESWTYFDAGTQIDLVDGEVLWDIEIEALPDGAWLPLMYDPMEFTMLASRADTLGMFPDVSLERLESDVDVEVDGAEVWAGEQLVLAFVDDLLVYVESFPLAPGDQEVAE